MGMAMAVLHWSAADFWACTPHELHAAAEALAAMHKESES